MIIFCAIFFFLIMEDTSNINNIEPSSEGNLMFLVSKGELNFDLIFEKYMTSIKFPTGN